MYLSEYKQSTINLHLFKLLDSFLLSKYSTTSTFLFQINYVHSTYTVHSSLKMGFNKSLINIIKATMIETLIAGARDFESSGKDL